MSSRTESLVIPLTLAGIILVIGASLWAETVGRRQVDFRRSQEHLLLSVDLMDLFDRPTRQKLNNGFWHHTLVRINTYNGNGTTPLQVTLRSCRLRYELWEEYYEVQLQGPNGTKNHRMSSASKAIGLCATVRQLPVLPLPAPRPGRYVFEFIAEVNPISPELLESVRRWLRSPQGGVRPVGGGQNFFGSMVSIFVNSRIGRSDRMIHFRTQPITL